MGAAVGGAADPEAGQRSMDGQGNKAIALKRARNVTLRDFAILNGGHFALLATGVDTLTIDNVRVDTNRDGFDIDASRNVRISNVAINSPNDDALVLKSSYALGEARPTENVTMTNVQVSGFDIGTVLDGTRKHTQERAPDRDGVTGRIKLGTESNGGFRNITISNCVFEWSRGLALETVDGGVLEDVTVTNVTMRHVTTAPIFLRLGNRARAPEGTPVAALRRVTISNIVASDVESRYAAILAGVPEHPVEDVLLSNIRLQFRGGGTEADANAEVAEHVRGSGWGVAGAARVRRFPSGAGQSDRRRPPPLRGRGARRPRGAPGSRLLCGAGACGVRAGGDRRGRWLAGQAPRRRFAAPAGASRSENLEGSEPPPDVRLSFCEGATWRLRPLLSSSCWP